MPKVTHEFRDPIHDFISVSNDERRVIDSKPVQRLRHVHQLAMSYLVYPGATHRRFEHSLGVMELAGQVFDVVTHRENITDQIRELVPELSEPDNFPYWRKILRMAALCHDIGHLPFSHAAEHQLLPAGHETLTNELLLNEMHDVWEAMAPPVDAQTIAKLAVGQSKAGAVRFSTWEALLSEIIVGDAFGVDRIDYLLRDSHHAGVAYGKFDHHRLISTLRILPRPPVGNGIDGEEDEDESREPLLGIEHGGIHAAEALLLARYFMFSQVYYHPVRLMYDVHLQDFLREWLPGGKYPGDPAGHLAMTDIEVLAGIRLAALNPGAGGHEPARRIQDRDHFRVLYERNPADAEINPEPGEAIFRKVAEVFGEGNVRHKRITGKGGNVDFPVLARDGRVGSSIAFSQTLQNLSPIAVDSVFISKEHLANATRLLRKEGPSIVRAAMEGSAE
jgi:uncharacterized protein